MRCRARRQLHARVRAVATACSGLRAVGNSAAGAPPLIRSPGDLAETALSVDGLQLLAVLDPLHDSHSTQGMVDALPDSPPAQPGAMRGQIQIAADFDAPLDSEFAVLAEGTAHAPSHGDGGGVSLS
mgnify:CR=1 FL=1